MMKQLLTLLFVLCSLAISAQTKATSVLQRKQQQQATAAAKPKQQAAPAAKPKQQAAPAAKPKQQTAAAAKPKQQAATAAKPRQQAASKQKSQQNVNNTVLVEENVIYDIVEQQPAFQGNVNVWIAQNIKYPPEAVKEGIEGKVIIQFVIGEDGYVRNPQVVRGVAPSLDNEAMRLIYSMPKWEPGKQNNEPVSCYFTLPITFRLQ